ncbi:MAG TPA: hypothetical protein EYQ00_02650 [Dehalococcoidia bacterium]|nr:hypothetical protein [Dehalococcoidia bacterium]
MSRPRPLTSAMLEATGPPDRTYKVVFAGDAAVGKTSFINRITKGFFVANISSTLGVDFQVKTIRVDERNIALQLWDTAGAWNFLIPKSTHATLFKICNKNLNRPRKVSCSHKKLFSSS